MPWKIIQDEQGWWVVRKGTGEKAHKSAHKNRGKAAEHMKALYASEDIGKTYKRK